MRTVKSEVDLEISIMLHELELRFDLRSLIAIWAVPSCISIGDYPSAAAKWWH